MENNGTWNSRGTERLCGPVRIACGGLGKVHTGCQEMVLTSIGGLGSQSRVALTWRLHFTCPENGAGDFPWSRAVVGRMNRRDLVTRTMSLFSFLPPIVESGPGGPWRAPSGPCHLPQPKALPEVTGTSAYIMWPTEAPLINTSFLTAPHTPQFLAHSPVCRESSMCS